MHDTCTACGLYRITAKSAKKPGVSSPRYISSDNIESLVGFRADKIIIIMITSHRIFLNNYT